MTRTEYKEEWVRLNTCSFCLGSQRHTCTSFRCQPAYERAKEYFENVIAKEEAVIERRYIIDLSAYFTSPKTREVIAGIWIIADNRKKELAIQFRNEVPDAQRAACLSLAVEGLEDVAADTKEKNPDAYILLDWMMVREWKENDEDAIRYGVRVDPKKNMQQYNK